MECGRTGLTDGVSAELVRGSGEVKVFLGNASSVVRKESKANLVIANVNIGMVASVFGEVADFVHEGEGGAEVLEKEGPGELTLLDLPVRYVYETRLNFVIGKRGHGFPPGSL